MSESKETNNENNQTRKAKQRKFYFVASVVLGVGLLYALLIAITVWHPGLQGQRLKFGAENGLTLAIVLTVIGQVLINRKQWQSTQDQVKAMMRQEKITRGALRQA